MFAEHCCSKCVVCVDQPYFVLVLFPLNLFRSLCLCRLRLSAALALFAAV